MLVALAAGCGSGGDVEDCNSRSLTCAAGLALQAGGGSTELEVRDRSCSRRESRVDDVQGVIDGIRDTLGGLIP